MIPQVSHEVIGETRFGDPKILVTVLSPHPKAGFRLIMVSTASMDHMAERMAATGKTSYLLYGYTDGYTDGAELTGGWHGATRATTLEAAVAEVAEYIGWLTEREALRERIETTALSEALRRFSDGLWDTSAIDYVKEWETIMAEVARIDLIMREGS